MGLGDTSQHPKPPGKGILCLPQSSTAEGSGESSERLRGFSARFMARVGSRESWGQQGWGGRKGRGRGGMREWDEPSGTPNCAAAAQRRAQPAHPTQPQKLPHPSPRRCLPERDVTAHPKNISRTLPQTLSAPGSTPPCSCPPRNCHTRTCGDFNTPTIKIPSHPGRN